MSVDNFSNKLENFIINYEKGKENLNILEFGVREGRSTKMFLDLCKRKGGKVLSIDVNDHSNLFNNNNWTFLKCRDDDYEKIKKYIKENLDLILIDSLHEPNHVSKLIYMYWDNLKLNGSMYIDDTSWLPYLKNNWRDHKFTENINRDTFYEILSIKNSNLENIDISFDFNGSGMCRLIKKSNQKLNKKKQIINRHEYFRNIIKIFLKKFKL